MNNKTLGLFFSYGVGIETWEKQGYLNRELKYYTMLGQQLGKVSFFTYDLRRSCACYSEQSEESLLGDSCTRSDLVQVCTRSDLVPSWLYVFLMSFLQAKAIKKCDILKTNQMSGALPAIIAKIIYRKKLVVRCGYEWLFTLSKAKKPLWERAIVYCLEFWAYKIANKIIFTSRADKDFAQKTFKIKESKIAIISNYIDIDLFKPMPELKKELNSVCFVGRLSREKNLKELIAAVNELPQVKLYIAGEGPEKEALQEQVQNNKNIVFLGKLPNEQLPALLNKCEVFVLPSLYEGNPKALLEAMACGLPCLTSDIEGIKETVSQNRNGLLVNPLKKDITKGLTLLLRDKFFAEQLGLQARETIEKGFALEQALEKEVVLLKDLIAN